MSAPWVWVVPEEKGGIRWYSDTLWPGISQAAPQGSRMLINPTVEQIAALKPALIHIQHEYGCFGSKIPGLYRFPSFLRELRRSLPDAKILATAHTVIPRDYRYPTRGRGWQTPLRAAANASLIPFLTRWWNRSTWAPLDAVIVQSKTFIATIQDAGCPLVCEIPLFVPEAGRAEAPPAQQTPSQQVVVFGYFSHDKGQDIAIQAMAELPESVHLVLAGGVRRPEDQPYFEACQRLIHQLGLQSRITVTGYVSDRDIDRHYQGAALVLAPFRESMGSGSIGQAFSRGKPVLASDLPSNQEITERVPGSLAFFRSEDPEDCAKQLKLLLNSEPSRQKLSAAARSYAERFSISASVQAHLGVYTEMGFF